MEGILPFVHALVVSSTVENEISVSYQSEGEYQGQIQLNKMLLNRHLLLNEQRGLEFPFFHDKLSAHKVIATSLTLHLPVSLPIDLTLENAKVVISGAFQNFYLSLKEGEVIINSPSLVGKIETKFAAIKGEALKSKAIINPSLKEEKGPLEKTLVLKSLHGKISTNSNRK